MYLAIVAPARSIATGPIHALRVSSDPVTKFGRYTLTPARPTVIPASIATVGAFRSLRQTLLFFPVFGVRTLIPQEFIIREKGR